MEEFPFTDAEWDPLKSVVDSILDARSAGDEAVVASLHLDMLDLVDGLRARHGDHPVLLETAADFTDDDAEGVILYRRAVEIAEANGLPTLSIRVALASNLMSLGEPAAALEELHACGGEAVAGPEDEQSSWLMGLEDAACCAADDAGKPRLFRRAAEIAAAHGLPALRFRLLLVRFLLDEGQPAAALEELRACEGDVPGGKEEDRVWRAELLEEASRAASNATRE